MHECYATPTIPAKCGPRIKYLIVLMESDPARLQSVPAQIHVATAANLVSFRGSFHGFRDSFFLISENIVVLCLSRAGKKSCE